MSYKIVNVFPDELLLTNQESSISLYQPTHRHGPDNQQDLIRFKNLIKKIEKSLAEKHDKQTIEKRMKPFYDFENDREAIEYYRANNKFPNLLMNKFKYNSVPPFRICGEIRNVIHCTEKYTTLITEKI